MVQADYAAARKECIELVRIASELIAIGCMAYVDGTTGDATGAYARLQAAVARRPDAAPGLRVWSHTRLAEFALHLGDAARAETHFRTALATGVEDNFLLAAYSDLLLEQRRPADALRLLSGRERSDTLLLRIALATKMLDSKDAARHVAALGARFDAAARRGERLHLAEEARYLLDLEGNAKAALAAALENWKAQREPRDAQVLLESALAASDPAAAAPALRWLSESGFQGPRLRALARRLEPHRP
jgi:predicted Zn-dependent protease